MQQSHWEVIILKPTSVFRSFILAQVPGVELPELSLMQKNTTAYTIPKRDNDQDTLDEIERHFATMFRHETSRWVGEQHALDIEGSFLDFLCCFKFELHSQIVLMEESIQNAHQLICVKPRSVLLKWIKSCVEQEPDLAELAERVSIAQLAENATVIFKNFNDMTEIKPFIQQYFRSILTAEMSRMSTSEDDWPVIDTFQKFNQYFTVEIHSQLIHLH